MPLRIPYAPGRAITIGGRPNPDVVRVRLLGRDVDRSQLTRIASAPGWVIVLARYDRKEHL